MTATGTYAINGTVLTTPPSVGQWLPRESLGISGLGHPIYPAPREFQMQFELIDAPSFNQLQNLYQNASYTGTVVATLPQYGATPYEFFSYTGCVLYEPSYDAYFEEHYVGVKMTIGKIVT